MKDVTGCELIEGDFLAISANVSTASQIILFGKVRIAKPNNVHVITVHTDSYSGKQYVYKSMIRKSGRILMIARDYVPEVELVVLDNE